MTCYECGKETSNTEAVSNNGDEPQVYCAECGGFPRHEYSVTCPTCHIEILVN